MQAKSSPNATVLLMRCSALSKSFFPYNVVLVVASLLIKCLDSSVLHVVALCTAIVTSTRAARVVSTVAMAAI